MKKLLLSFFVIGAFVFYSVHQRQEASEASVSMSLAPTDMPSGNSSSAPTPMVANTGVFRDGVYTGKSADAFYGFIQVKAAIQNGRIADIQFLDYPSDRSTSQMINDQAMPLLKQEAIKVQNANVDIVSGATDSSMAFRESLQSALIQAH